ncbi:MAG: hypothetical protein ACTSQJ_10995 [Promethearchaeota archaeon]
MEGITHILTGILIQILCFIFFPFLFAIIFTFIFGFFSHFIIDTLAKMTYHTPEPHKEDKFWVYWHIITISLIFILIIWILVINWILFFFFIFGGVAANLVDIWDWVILRPKQRKKKAEDPNAKFWGDNLFIHPVIDWIREKPFFWLPNWNEKKKGITIEIITIVVLWTLIAYFLPLLSI